MTVEGIINEVKYLRVHNVSIHINFDRNRFINQCVRKTFLKFPYRRSFFVRCRRTYVLNKFQNTDQRDNEKCAEFIGMAFNTKYGGIKSLFINYVQ